MPRSIDSKESSSYSDNQIAVSIESDNPVFSLEQVPEQPDDCSLDVFQKCMEKDEIGETCVNRPGHSRKSSTETSFKPDELECQLEGVLDTRLDNNNATRSSSQYHLNTNKEEMEEFFDNLDLTYFCLKNRFSDCVVKCGDIEVPAHRVVLASCSRFFFKTFEDVRVSDGMNRLSEVVLLPKTPKSLEYLFDVPNAFTQVFEAMYRRPNKTDHDGFLNLLGVHYFSKILRISFLEETTRTIIYKRMKNSRECMKLLYYAVETGDSSLQQLGEEEVSGNFADVVSRPRNLDIMFELPLQVCQNILSSDDLGVTSEDEVYFSVRSLMERQSMSDQLQNNEENQTVREQQKKWKRLTITLIKVTLEDNTTAACSVRNRESIYVEVSSKNKKIPFGLDYDRSLSVPGKEGGNQRTWSAEFHDQFQVALLVDEIERESIKITITLIGENRKESDKSVLADGFFILNSSGGINESTVIALYRSRSLDSQKEDQHVGSATVDYHISNDAPLFPQRLDKKDELLKDVRFYHMSHDLLVEAADDEILPLSAKSAVLRGLSSRLEKYEPRHKNSTSNRLPPRNSASRSTFQPTTAPRPTNYETIYFEHFTEFDGVLTFLGTSGRVTGWRNPASIGEVQVTSSGLGVGKPEDVVGREAVNVRTTNFENSFIELDFMEDRLLQVTGYSLRNRPASTHCLMSWNFEVTIVPKVGMITLKFLF
eukprot:GHVL01009845.1.p1 GENE.GHVL01009845.1~~GHVL01009845.1.p1  ORF type:complete len:709 (+),score=104.39 GHVL01009845.1:31-2157(+)